MPDFAYNTIHSITFKIVLRIVFQPSPSYAITPPPIILANILVLPMIKVIITFSPTTLVVEKITDVLFLLFLNGNLQRFYISAWKFTIKA